VLRCDARVTAIADKLGLEFALFHRKRDGKSEDAPEKLELLVGDVKNKVSILYICRTVSCISSTSAYRLLLS
jgi:phosphoribosylpyrophosphate synthetase